MMTYNNTQFVSLQCKKGHSAQVIRRASLFSTCNLSLHAIYLLSVYTQCSTNEGLKDKRTCWSMPCLPLATRWSSIHHPSDCTPSNHHLSMDETNKAQSQGLPPTSYAYNAPLKPYLAQATCLCPCPPPRLMDHQQIRKNFFDLKLSQNLSQKCKGTSPKSP